MQNLDAEFLSLLCCPETRAPLVRVDDWLYSTDAQSRRRYPIRDGIPVMLIDESEIVSEEEHRQAIGAANSEEA